MANKLRSSRGFTLIELLIATTLLGLITLVISPFFKMFITAKEQSYREKQYFYNMKISQAMLGYAKQSSVTSTLPVPYADAGGKVYSGVLNPANTALTQALIQANLNLREINGDGTAADNVRVFQKKTGLTQVIPLFFQAGPQVTLTYEYGVIYMTSCMRDGSGNACNPTPATGIPGFSPSLSALADPATWVPSSQDTGVVAFSTLQLQKDMLEMSAKKLEKVRDALTEFFRAKQLAAAATDTTNWYPVPDAGATAVGTGTDGCAGAWVALSGALVLPQVGLTESEFSKTAWGGDIQYCRDYDPASAGAGVPPHYGALRIHKSVSTGTVPDPGVTANNIVLSF